MVRRSDVPWVSRAPNVRGCKLGTVPAVVQVHGSDLRKVAIGNWIRVREAENGPWSSVYVRSVDDESGHFQADR